jgi:hypothetical protein
VLFALLFIGITHFEQDFLCSGSAPWKGWLIKRRDAKSAEKMPSLKLCVLRVSAFKLAVQIFNELEFGCGSAAPSLCG